MAKKKPAPKKATGKQASPKKVPRKKSTPKRKTSKTAKPSKPKTTTKSKPPAKKKPAPTPPERKPAPRPKATPKTKSPAKPLPATGDYGRVKEQAAEASRNRSQAGRDIGSIPAVQNPGRRKESAKSLRFHCETYYPDAFYLGWSDDHLRVIEKLEAAILEGAMFALAMPRGSGKTTLAICATLWALLHAYRRFVALIAANETAAVRLLDAVKSELENNMRLLADFPEVCYPLHRLERIYNRCKGQTCEGKPTRIEFTNKQLILPTIEGSASSTGILQVAGLTGGFRGMRYNRPDGSVARPDFALIDDPQTDKSAASIPQCEERERLINGAVKGLAGPGKKLSAVMPCTVIRNGDMAHRFLKMDIHPEWNGECIPLMRSLPTNEKLWDEYAELRCEGFKAGDGGKSATQFYKANRKAMDRGADPSWLDRYDPDEISAVQNAMNLKLDDEHTFWAEYQNAPLDTDMKPTGILTADQIADKLNGLGPGELLQDASEIVAFIDVQGKMLFYTVMAFAPNFTGQVLEYGGWPDQGRPYYTLRQAKNTLARKAPGAGLEGQIYNGLEELTKDLMGRIWHRADGSELQICKAAIDANWGPSTDIIKAFCRANSYGGRLLPAHGRFYGATTNPINDAARKPGEQRGPGWRIPPAKRGHLVRHLLYDVNYYKSFLHARLAVSIGDRGSVSLPGRRSLAHRMFADHLAAESPEEVTARDRTVMEWKLNGVGVDNHWLDCAVGCCTLASVQGCELLASSTGKATREKPLKLSEIQAERRRRKAA